MHAEIGSTLGQGSYYAFAVPLLVVVLSLVGILLMKPIHHPCLLIAALVVAGGCASSATGIRPGEPPVPCAQFSLPLPSGVTFPRALSRAQTPAPFDGTRAGYVCVNATITLDGLVVDAEVVSTDHPAFARAFIDALSQWRFEPPLRDGSPIELRTSFSASFLRTN